MIDDKTTFTINEIGYGIKMATDEKLTLKLNLERIQVEKITRSALLIPHRKIKSLISILQWNVSDFLPRILLVHISIR